MSILLAVYGGALLIGSRQSMLSRMAGSSQEIDFGLAIFGWIADNTESRRTPWLFGLLALAGSTAMLCVGTSVGILLAGRILQGFSGAIVGTAGLALLVDTVGHEHIGEAMGYVSIALSLGILLAPLLAGVVYDRGGYYAVFAMAFAAIGVDLFFRVFLIEKKIAAKWLDVGGSEVVETSASVDARDEEVSGESTTTIARKRTRLPPIITLLKSRRLLSALWCTMVQASIFTCFESVGLPFSNTAIDGADVLCSCRHFRCLCIEHSVGVRLVQGWYFSPTLSRP